MSYYTVLYSIVAYYNNVVSYCIHLYKPKPVEGYALRCHEPCTPSVQGVGILSAARAPWRGCAPPRSLRENCFSIAHFVYPNPQN